MSSKKKTEVSYENQIAFFDPENFAFPVHIIGAGSIGSMALFALSAMGVSDIHIWDADNLEPRNVPTQPIYRIRSDNGRSKVEAAAGFIKRQQLPTELTLHEEFVDQYTPLNGVVISGVDSMQARKEIYAAVINNSAKIPLYMDGRIGGENLTLFAFRPVADRNFRTEIYEARWMFDDSKAAQLPCGGRNIIGPPMVLAGFIAESLSLWYRNLSFEHHIYFTMKDMVFNTLYYSEGGE